MQTLDQQYALDVYQRVMAAKEHFKEKARKYGVMCHKLPLLIHTAGLAQALAFVESRNEEVYTQLIQDLAQTLKQEGNLAQETRRCDLNDYMRLTWQIMDALLWYKRFAQSVLGVDASTGDEQEV